jgi:hypothetical protein
MRWACFDGIRDGRFRGELDVKSRCEQAFCRFWTRGWAAFAADAQDARYLAWRVDECRPGSRAPQKI